MIFVHVYDGPVAIAAHSVSPVQDASVIRKGLSIPGSSFAGTRP